MPDRCAEREEQVSIALRLGRLRFSVALLGVFVLEYAGIKLLGISGSGLFIPLRYRIIRYVQRVQ